MVDLQASTQKAPKDQPIELVIAQPAEVVLKPQGKQLQCTTIYLRAIPQRAGQGRHAVVFAASGKPNGAQNLAVKFLRKEDGEEYNALMRERFFAEIKALHGIEPMTPGIVRYHGFGLTNAAHENSKLRGKDIGIPTNSAAYENAAHETFSELEGVFYVMDKAHCSLDDFLYSNNSRVNTARSWRELVSERRNDGHRFFDLAFCFTVFSRAASAVEKFHSLKKDGLVYAHRDIKPGNFLVLPEGEDFNLCLTDFGGLNQNISSNEHVTSSTVSDHPRAAMMNQPGSRGYRSPEQRNTGLSVLARISYKSTALPVEGGKSIPEPAPIGKYQVRIELVQRDFDISFGLGDVVHLSEAILGEKRFLIVRVESNVGLAEIQVSGENWNIYPKSIESVEIYGTLHLAQGQPTDTFAMGCLLYHLGSGGKDAERFIYSVMALALEKEGKSLSCGAIASILFAGENEELSRECKSIDENVENACKIYFGLNGKLDDMVLRERKGPGQAELLADLKSGASPSNTAGLIERTLPTFFKFGKHIIEAMRDPTKNSGGLEAAPAVSTSPYGNEGETRRMAEDNGVSDIIEPAAGGATLKGGDVDNTDRTLEKMFRAIASDRFIRSEYLTDKAGKPICWAILAGTLACVLRNYPGSVCKSPADFGHLSRVVRVSRTLAQAMLDLAPKDERPKETVGAYYARFRESGPSEPESYIGPR